MSHFLEGVSLAEAPFDMEGGMNNKNIIRISLVLYLHNDSIHLLSFKQMIIYFMLCLLLPPFLMLALM